MKNRLALSLAVGLGLTILCPAANLVLEAEAYLEIEAPFVWVEETSSPPAGVVIVPGASKGTYVALPQGSGNPPKLTKGKLVYDLEIAEEGVYVLWLRAYWDDSCGNSVSVQVADHPAFMVEDSTYKTWHWVKSPPRLNQLRLSAGKIRLTLLNREDGVRVDQILLTRSARYIPVDLETP